MEQISTKPRIQQLDVLRGIAIALVLFNHVPHVEAAGRNLGGSLLLAGTYGGWIGVDLFFVLSGFLVSGLLFRKVLERGTVDLKRFLIRRAFKIFPALYLLIAYSVFDHWRNLGHGPEYWQLFADLFFLQNYLGSSCGHLWSIAIEEHFYILLAIIVGLHLRSARLRKALPDFAFVPKLFAFTAVTCFALRYIRTVTHPEFEFYTHLTLTHHRVDALMFGVFLAYLKYFKPSQFAAISAHPRRLIALSSAIFVFPFLLERSSDTMWICSFGLTVTYLAAGGLLIGMLQVKPIPVFARPLAWLGFYSYSLYLFHNSVSPLFINQFHPERGILEFYSFLVFYLLMSVLVGVIVANLVELPALKLREIWFPDTSPNEASRPRMSPDGSGRSSESTSPGVTSFREKGHDGTDQPPTTSREQVVPF